ncbi:hypothetical protein SAMN05421850_10533 [Lutimaribacter saemankumensis]|uniref:Uncharacterized protein n=1 Tax=Lutimaribacter saemankumensis TaxID=490829 RepID=A0A1G8N239_9RHOB|nr:hypothetical protein SAMN05421850_10533 [Lutimaribacter saemankumensis]
MTRFPGTGLAAFAMVSIVCVDGAMADPVSYRFEAEFRGGTGCAAARQRDGDGCRNGETVGHLRV